MIARIFWASLFAAFVLWLGSCAHSPVIAEDPCPKVIGTPVKRGNQRGYVCDCAWLGDDNVAVKFCMDESTDT